MSRGPLLALVLALLAFAPTAGASDRAPAATLGPLANVEVEGSGPIQWKRVAVRAHPALGAPVIRTLEQFRPDFHPRWVLAVDAKRDAVGTPKWYEIQLPGRPNGQRGRSVRRRRW